MLNIVWPLFLILSIIYAILVGNLSQLNSAIFESTSTAVNLCITLVGTMTLWSGIMNIASKTSAMKKITRILSPIIKLLFPKIDKDSKLYEEISMNIVANILGLGNAATPLRFKSNENNARKKSSKRNINK